MEVDALLSMGGLKVSFKNLHTMGSFSLGVRGRRLCKLVKPGNTNGAAMFGLLAKMCGPSSKGILLSKGSLAKGGGVRVDGTKVTEAFRGVHLFGRLAILSGIGMKLRGRRRCSAVRKVLELPGCHGMRGRVSRGTVRLLGMFSLRGFTSCGTTGLPCKRREGLRVTETLTASPGLLLLSRPTTKVGPGRAKRLVSVVHFIESRFRVAVLLVRRSVGLMDNVYRRLAMLGFNRMLTRNGAASMLGSPRMVGTCLKR